MSEQMDGERRKKTGTKHRGAFPLNIGTSAHGHAGSLRSMSRQIHKDAWAVRHSKRGTGIGRRRGWRRAISSRPAANIHTASMFRNFFTFIGRSSGHQDR